VVQQHVVQNDRQLAHLGQGDLGELRHQLLAFLGQLDADDPGMDGDTPGSVLSGKPDPSMLISSTPTSSG
jgi:hypothetical protein